MRCFLTYGLLISVLLVGSNAAFAADKESKPSNRDEGSVPMWIWAAEGGDACQLHKQFPGGAIKADLIATCDNKMIVSINGHQVAASDEWKKPVKADVTKWLVPGDNQIRVEASNTDGLKGVVMKLVLTMPDGSRNYVVTDRSWKGSASKRAKPAAPVQVFGKMGIAPWGNVFASSAPQTPAAPRGVFKTLPGFNVERLYAVPKAEQGSWVAMTFDDQGRIIASDQSGKGLYRITPAPIGSDEKTKVEKIAVKISGAQGLLHAFDSLYVATGSGLYRARDTDNDDQYDELVRLKELRGVGEHGVHALRLSPDGKSIYLIAGNHTTPPEKFDASRVPSKWGEDHLLPRQWDAQGHARGKLAPGAWIAKTDPDGKRWEIISIGQRNPYDMAFNADGELFAYDADMEWDMGMPWYRPTRIVHATSGSEFGWRSGTGKWPTYYVDSLPPVLDIGPGSPVGVTFGYGAKFPAKYQKALFLLDWTFGTMYAIHLEPDGASYKAVKEEFLSRTPLPLTDAAIGPDGALYFTIGGRDTQSELYRVTYNGKVSTAPVDAHDPQFADLRNLRHQMEALHGPASAAAIHEIWPQLGHADRHVRYAARVALEHQDVQRWQDRALAEKDPQTSIQAIVALARQGDKTLQPRLLASLDRLDFGRLSVSEQLDALRAYQLVFTRMGKPDAATATRVARHFDPLYPSTNDAMNRELSRLLVYLNSPTVASKTLALLERPTETKTNRNAMTELLARSTQYGGAVAKVFANQPEMEKLHLAFVLRNLRYGWTIDERKRYFKFLDSSAKKNGGLSYVGFLKNMRTDALANASPAERLALAATAPPSKPVDLPAPKGPGRAWSVDRVTATVERGLTGRDFENGKRTFAAARCVVCHRFDGAGGATGPDLTNVAGRFSLRDLAEAMILPSKVISDQYGATVIETGDGKMVTGRIVGDNIETIVVQTDPEDATKITTIVKENIESKEASRISLMPAKLLDVLSEQEIRDLIAYLMSRGNPNDPMFGE